MNSQGFSPVFFHKVHLCAAAFQGIMLILAVIHDRPKAAIWSAIFFAFALFCCRYYRSKIERSELKPIKVNSLSRTTTPSPRQR